MLSCEARWRPQSKLSYLSEELWRMHSVYKWRTMTSKYSSKGKSKVGVMRTNGKALYVGEGTTLPNFISPYNLGNTESRWYLWYNMAWNPAIQNANHLEIQDWMKVEDQDPRKNVIGFLVGELKILLAIELHTIDETITLRTITNMDFSFKREFQWSPEIASKCDYPPTRRDGDTGVDRRKSPCVSLKTYSDISEDNIRYGG